MMLRAILCLTYSGGVQAKDAQTLLELTPDGEDAMRFKTGYQKDLEESYHTGEAKGLEQGLEQEKLAVVANMIAQGFDWGTIAAITQLDQAGYAVLAAKYNS